MNGIFIGEMIIKVIALGFISGSNTYLRDDWSKLDFVIVVFTITDLMLE